MPAHRSPAIVSDRTGRGAWALVSLFLLAVLCSGLSLLFGSGRDAVDVTDVYETLGQADRSCEDRTWPSIDRRCLTAGGATVERASREMPTDRVPVAAATGPEPETRREKAEGARRTAPKNYEAIAQLTPAPFAPSETAALYDPFPEPAGSADPGSAPHATDGRAAAEPHAESRTAAEEGQTAAQRQAKHKSVEPPSVNQAREVDGRSAHVKRTAKRAERRFTRQWQRNQARAQELNPAWRRQARRERARSRVVRSWQDAERHRMARSWGEPGPAYAPPRPAPYAPFGQPLFWRF